MKLALISTRSIDFDIQANLETIKTTIMRHASKVDVICFGEAFLTGFDSLVWVYGFDVKRAISQDSSIIAEIRSQCAKYRIAVSFGYFELYNDRIYCSYMFIGRDGNIIDNYRRVSKGWKEPLLADSHYEEGDGFHSFKYLDKNIVVALCGDLWEQGNIDAITKLDYDFILWPLYVVFPDKKRKLEEKAYAAQAGLLKKKVLFVNSVSFDARGGCYVFEDERIVDSLAMGREGSLLIDV